MIEGLTECLWAFLGTISFGIIFNIRGKNLIYASLGGLLAWVVYLLSGACLVTEVMQYFFAAVVISFYSEIMAIWRKAPVTVFILSGMIPLVPGGRIFYTMQELIMKSYSGFVETGFYTFAIAGAIAMGILIASFIVRLAKYLYRSQKGRAIRQ